LSTDNTLHTYATVVPAYQLESQSLEHLQQICTWIYTSHRLERLPQEIQIARSVNHIRRLLYRFDKPQARIMQ